MIVSSSRWLRFWDKLTEPTPALTLSDERRKARTLASLLLILIPLLVIDTISAYALSVDIIGFVLTLPVLVFAYYCSRRRRYQLGGILMLAIVYLLPLMTALANSGYHAVDLLFVLKYPLFNIVVAHLLFPRRVYTVVALVFISALLINLRSDNFVLSDILTSMDLLLTSVAVVAVLMFVRRNDMRERRQAEAFISQSEERYRILSTLMSDYVYAMRLNPNGTTGVEWMAGAVEAITGYSIQEASNLSISKFVHPEDMPKFHRRREHLAEGKSDVTEYRIVTKTGQVRWLRDYGYGVTHPVTRRMVAYYGAAQDITEHKSAEEALRESEARFRAIAEASIIGILIATAEDNRIVYSNQQAAALFGTTTDQLIGLKSGGLITDKADEQDLMAEIAQKGFIYNQALRARRLNGAEFWVDLSVKEIILDGEPMRLYAISEITERKVAELALEQSRAQYETLVNSIDGVVWEAEAQTNIITFISRQVERLLGFPVDCFTSEPGFWQNRIHPADQEESWKTRGQEIAAGRSFQQEYRMIAADGHIVWIRDIVTLVKEENSPALLRGLAINITASKEAQAAELEQRRLADALRQSAAAISTSLDSNEVLDRILAQLTLVAPVKSADIMLIEDGVARVVRSMGYGEFEEQVRELRLPIDQTLNLRQMIESGQPLIIADTQSYESWVDVPPSRWIQSMTGAPIRLDDQTIGFLNMNADVPNAFTEEHTNRLQAFANQVAIAIRNARLYEETRRYAEGLATLVKERTAELDVERQRIEFILEATGEGVFYTEGTRIFYANAAMCRLTGYTQGELIGQSMRILAADHLTRTERHFMVTALNHVRNDTIWRGEMQLRRKDGTVFDAGLTISLVGEPHEKPLRAVTIMRDVSKEKALQAQKSRLVAHASHELRTPITNLKTRLYLLRRRPENLEYHLGILEEVTERMKRLVEDLLDISRLERGVIPLQREKLQVQPLIERIVQVQQPEAERKQQTLTLDALPTPLFVYADAERLTQVITNLLINAINYTPASGTIRVSVDSDMSGKTVIIRIADTGIGIDSDNLPHIFQPFFRVVSEVEGTGLGLSIAKEIIEMHDGTIEVESVYGTGSTFTVRLGLVLQPTTISV